MTKFSIEGFLGDDTPALFDVTILAHSDYDQGIADPKNSIVDDYPVKAMLDTGSRQTLMIPGLFDDCHFGANPLSVEMTNASRQVMKCRGQRMSLLFKSGMRSKKIELPIYEMQFAAYPTGFLLIGRSLLNHAVFTYDGPNKKVAITFADDNRLVL